MGNLVADTSVTHIAEGEFRASLSKDWDIWGPAGGYLAATALRAAGAHSTLARPTSIACHFLGVAEFADVEVSVTTLRKTRRAESLRVQVQQADKLILEAIVWATAAGVKSPDRNWIALPDVPSHEELPTILDRVRAEGGLVLPIWETKSYELRPVGWVEGGMARPEADPTVGGWISLGPATDFADDPWVDACRATFVLDVVQFPSVAQGFAAAEVTWVAPSLDLYVAFYRGAPEHEWLLAMGQGVAVGDGIHSGQAKLWSPDGHLVASASQQMLHRSLFGG